MPAFVSNVGGRKRLLGQQGKCLQIKRRGEPQRREGVIFITEKGRRRREEGGRVRKEKKEEEGKEEVDVDDDDDIIYARIECDICYDIISYRTISYHIMSYIL